MNKLKVIFLGTPDFSVPTLEALFMNPLVELSLVISKIDKKQGRGQKVSSPPVIEFSKSKKIKSIQTENINKDEELLSKLQDAKPDLFIVLAFSQFLSQKVLEMPRLGCYNIHTSLLPKYRGAAPIQAALLNSDPSTGVSIQRMVKKMDAGDVCLSKPVEIHDYENAGLLYTKLKFQAALSINDFIHNVYTDSLQFTTQDESLVSFAPKISKKDGRIDFLNDTPKTLQSKLRAYFPWPGVYCMLGDKILKVFSIQPSSKNLSPGELSTELGVFTIGLQSGSVRINELQLEGKKRMTDTQLLNGLKTNSLKVS